MEEFNILGLGDQAKLVWDGEFIEHRHLEDTAISLYCLGKFFVEAWYDKEHTNFIKFHAFESSVSTSLYSWPINN